MNARARLFAISVQKPAARFLGGAAACALLGGCVGNPLAEAQVDPRSPVAAEVPNAIRAGPDYPTFAEIPAAPKDLRPKPLYGAQAAELDRTRAQVVRETAPDTWTLSNTEGFAAQARQAAGPEVAPASPADTEAFANALRKRATPPPPPKR
jgi:hypothetical protein